MYQDQPAGEFALKHTPVGDVCRWGKKTRKVISRKTKDLPRLGDEFSHRSVASLSAVWQKNVSVDFNAMHCYNG